MPPPPAASLGQLAVLCRLITEAEHAKLRRVLQARTRGRRPTSLARLLLRSGFGSRTVRRLLRLGVDLQAVRCDGCGRAIPQGELPSRVEAPCAACGALVLGFAAFKKRGAAPAAARGLWDSSGSASDAEHTLMADGVRLPGFPALEAVTPGGGSSSDDDGANTTVGYSGVLGLPEDLADTSTLPFDDVLALPAAGRGPRSEEETIVAWSTLVCERPLGPRAPVKLVNPLPARPTARSPASSAPSTEQRLGDWVVLRELGEGGVGKVFLARHAARGDAAALKVLKAEVVRDQECVERFKREAEAALRIKHPNVVALIEAGRDPKTDQQFIAYEYLDGGSLLDLLATRGRLGEREALRLSRGVALALGVAEAHRLVHRDVKPENILLTSDGVAKLGDLGLIKLVDRATRLTQVGIVVGTPCYMAPEQALGEDEVDVRADIYALGLVLWQMLAGSVPFEDEEELPALELMTRHIEEDVPDVRLERPGVSDATAQVVKWMTARAKEERYPDPHTLARDVDLVLAGQLPLGPRVVVAAGSAGSGAGAPRGRPGGPEGPEGPGAARAERAPAADRRAEAASFEDHPDRGGERSLRAGQPDRSGRRPQPAPPPGAPVGDVLAVTLEAAPPPGAVVATPAGGRPAAFVLLVALLVVTPVACLVTAAALWMKFGDRLR